MRSLVTAALLVACAGCASSRLSDEVLGIARTTRPGGAFHVEFGNDGRLIEAAGDVALESVPASCRAAADREFPGGRQVGAERALVDDTWMWTIAKDVDGRSLEILVRDDATVFGGEEVLQESAWPAGVVDAAKAAVPGGTLDRVERVWGPEARGAEAFHVKFTDRGDSVRVGVSSDAKVVRVVRRISGQVRIPR